MRFLGRPKWRSTAEEQAAWRAGESDEDPDLQMDPSMEVS